MNLFARFSALKQKVSGNLEKHAFEFTMGLDNAEVHGVTPISASVKRILSEINFALQLSGARDHAYDAAIDSALTVLENAMSEEQCLPKAACMQAEEKLSALRDDAKSYEVLYVSHAHIDMNWMWGWQETVAVALSTFRTMLNLMKEYPEFTFSQSQASVYRIVEKYDPEMMEEIKARIQEGRWEITANAWVETDKNMPDTESLLHHIQVTRDYLEKVWGIDPGTVKVDFSPDTFGHSRFIPEINNFGNVPYYYHCRGLQDDVTLYRFRSPSGAETLNYKEPYWYNSGVCPDNGTGAVEMARRCGGLKTSMIVYGVGNHGGGATRRDVEAVLEMQKWPIFPTLRFGTLHEYFAKAESVREKLPVIDHELNAIFTGCYSTQSRIKLANRRSEAALIDSECVNALVHHRLGGKVASDAYAKAWENTLFTHFHDILTGSCVQESREYAMGLLADSLAYTQTEQSKGYTRWSEAVDTSLFAEEGDISRSMSEGAGVGYGISHYAGVPNPERGVGLTRPYTIFNPSAYDRKEVVELLVWDYAGDIHRLEVVDSEGKPVPFAYGEIQEHYWDHKRTRLLVEAEVPAFGHAVYAVRQAEVTSYPTFLLEAERVELPKDKIVLENDFIRATFDTGCGKLLSLTDKASGEELLSAPAGLYLVRTEDSDMSAWRIGRYMGMEPVELTSHVTTEKNDLRQSVTFQQEIMHSKITFTVSLDKNAKALKYDLNVDWHETAKAQNYLPLLSFRLPLKKHAEQILTDVPAGFAYRPSREMDVPALTGACADVTGTTAALISDCKYGFRLAEDVLSITLINTGGTPDPYPERGVHAIQVFVALTEAVPALLKQTAQCLIRPMAGVPTAAHKGELASKASLMRVDAPHSIVSAVETAKDGALLLRFFEDAGTDDKITIEPPFKPQKAVLTGLDGKVVGKARIVKGKVVFELGAFRIGQVLIYS